MSVFRGLLMLACISALASPAALSESSTAGADIAKIVFSELEKQIMKRYFDVHSTEAEEGEDSSKGKGKGKKSKKGEKRGLPPGLAKRQELPPGLAKRETLPPGLAKRDLPEDLESLLPGSDPGVERVIIDNSVVLIEKATNRVLDILEDIMLGDQ